MAERDDSLPPWLSAATTMHEREVAILRRLNTVRKAQMEAMREHVILRNEGARLIVHRVECMQRCMQMAPAFAVWKAAPTTRKRTLFFTDAPRAAASFDVGDAAASEFEAELASMPMPDAMRNLTAHTPTSTPSRMPPMTPSPVPTIRAPPQMVHQLAPQWCFDRRAAAIAALGHRHAVALMAIEEHCGNLEEMVQLPNYDMQAYLTSKALDYGARFKVITYLAMNRCPPILAVELMDAAGQLSDQAAADHCLSLLKRLAAAQFEKYRAFCEESKAWEDVSPPASGTPDWRHAGDDWTNAIAKMQSVRQRLQGVRKV